MLLLGESFDYPDDNRRQEHDNGNFIYSMHHAKINVVFFVWIGFLKNPEEIIPQFSQLEEILDFAICHFSPLLNLLNDFTYTSGSIHLPSFRMISINSSTARSEGTDFLITSFPL